MHNVLALMYFSPSRHLLALPSIDFRAPPGAVFSQPRVRNLTMIIRANETLKSDVRPTTLPTRALWDLIRCVHVFSILSPTSKLTAMSPAKRNNLGAENLVRCAQLNPPRKLRKEAVLYHFVQFVCHASHPISGNPRNNFFSILAEFGDLSDN
jgi:hypothetical protein